MVAALATGGAWAEVAVVPAALALPIGDLPLRTAAGFGWGTPTAYDLVLDDERFDVILDPVGGRTRQEGLRLLAPHGRLVAYGALDGREPVPVGAGDLFMTGRSLVTYNSDLPSRTHPDHLADSAWRALDLLARGRIRIDITAEYDRPDSTSRCGG